MINYKTPSVILDMRDLDSIIMILRGREVCRIKIDLFYLVLLNETRNIGTCTITEGKQLRTKLLSRLLADCEYQVQ